MYFCLVELRENVVRFSKNKQTRLQVRKQMEIFPNIKSNMREK